MKNYSSAAITKTGRRRNNQDNFMLGGKYAELNHDTFTYKCEGKTKKPFFTAVCDGMGGEASGERASYEACKELAEVSAKLTGDFAANKMLVCDSILHANTRLCDVMQNEGTGRMGSTVISVLIQGDTLFYTNLGDSRIYLLRNGVLRQITKDHTEGQSMVDAGVLTEEQLKKHPSRNKLNRHLGIFPEEMVLECPTYEDIKLKAGDKLLLCSDGVFGVLEGAQIVSILSEKTSAEERAAELVDTAYASASKDNMTAMVIDIENAMPVLLPVICSASAIALCVLLALIVKGSLNSKTGTPDHTDTTAEPTEIATDQPAETAATSDDPTAAPTEQITAEPTPTLVPTPEPTESPTETPFPTSTPNPTSVLTAVPTAVPTETATALPTETAEPSVSPTNSGNPNG